VAGFTVVLTSLKLNDPSHFAMPLSSAACGDPGAAQFFPAPDTRRSGDDEPIAED
jgi:hypothetical protein